MKCKKRVEKKRVEVVSLNEKLYPLLNQDGSLREVVKERVIREFCEGDGGRNWFFEISLSSLNATVLEVVQDVLKKDTNYEFPYIMKRYYDEDVQVPTFPQDRRALLGIEDSSPILRDVNMEEEDQQSYQGND